MILLNAFLIAAALGAGAPFRNGDFSEGTAHWSMPSAPFYRFDAKGGANGSGGLTFANEDVSRNSFGGYPGQRVAFESGKVYRFSGLVRAAKSAAPGAKFTAFVFLDISDANGKWICEYRTKEVSDTAGEWVRLTGETPPIPAKAGRITVCTAAHGAGQAAFDEVTFALKETKAVCELASSAYRDTAWTGRVRFDARLGIDAAKTPLSGLKAAFVLPDAKGRPRSVPAETLAADAASASVDVSALPVGTFTVAFELKKSDGTLLGRETLRFTRTAGNPGWKVWIDEHGRTIVDGKPFFPLGFFHGGIDEKTLDAYCRGPFNCVLPYPVLPRSAFDLCQRRGLKMISSLMAYKLGFAQCPVKAATQDEVDCGMAARMREVMDHPALLGWYLADEWPVTERDLLISRYGLARRTDPDHPAYAVQFQFDQIPEYRATCDVIGTDPYPIPDRPVGTCALHTRRTKRGMGNGPVWQVLQAFDWKWFGSKMKDPRLPTREEIRSMAWQSVANGANGLIFYNYAHFAFRTKDDGFDAKWKDYCVVAKEIADRFPVLLADPALDATGFPEGVSGRAWTKGGFLFLLVVNETREMRKADLRLPRTCRTFRHLLDSVSAGLDGDRLHLELPGMGVAFLALNP